MPGGRGGRGGGRHHSGGEERQEICPMDGGLKIRKAAPHLKVSSHRMPHAQAFDVFAPYAGPTLDAVWRHWRFTSGYTGFLTIEDFLKLVTWAEDRATRESQRFWWVGLGRLSHGVGC